MAHKYFFIVLITFGYLLATPAQINKSDDRNNLYDVWAIGIAENSSGDIFICLPYSGPFIAKSTDGGINWTLSDSGFTYAEPEFIICDENDNIYFSGHQTSLYKSSDDGTSWEQFAPFGNPYHDVYSITITDNGYLYLGVFDDPDTTVLKTTDGGFTWQDCSNGINSYVNCVTSFQNTIFAGTLHHGLLYSTNQGISWQQTAFDSGYVESVVFDDSGLLYSSHNKRVYKSTNMGTSWAEIFSSDNFFYGKILPISENKIFLINLDFIYRTFDGGVVWDTISTFVNQVSYLNDIYFSSDSALYLTSNIGVFKSFDFGDTWNPVDLGITSVSSEEFTPENFKLEQNYPNPFNPSTKIGWQSPIGSHQTLKVYDMLGREVATLVDEYKPAGSYEVEFNAASHSGNVRNLPSGIYFYTLKAGNFVQTNKMILMK